MMIECAGQSRQRGWVEAEWESFMHGIPTIVFTLVFGGVAGWLASLLVGGRGGLSRNIVVGLIGAVVGHFIFGGLGWFLGAPLLGSLLSAVLGAAIVLIVARLLA